MNCVDNLYESLIRKGVSNQNAKIYAWIRTQTKPATHLLKAICFPGYRTKITNYNPAHRGIKLQTISKLQITMIKTFQSLIGCLAVILAVLNFEFRSLIPAHF